MISHVTTLTSFPAKVVCSNAPLRASNPQRTPLLRVHEPSLLILRSSAHLTTADIISFLLHRILLMVIIAHQTSLLARYLVWNEASRRVLDWIFQRKFALISRNLTSLLAAGAYLVRVGSWCSNPLIVRLTGHIHWRHATNHISHLAHGPNLIDTVILVVCLAQTVGSSMVASPYRRSWLLAVIATPSTTLVRRKIPLRSHITIVSVLHSHCSFHLLVSSDQLVHFWFSDGVEPGFLEALDSGEALLRIQSKHAFQTVERILGHLVEIASFESLRLADVGELEAHKTRILIEKFLLLGGQFAENFLDAEKLVDFRLAREKCITVTNFAHNTPNSPDINFFSIVVGEKEFWGAVPSCGDVICQTHSRLIILEHSCEPKVTNFKLVGLSVQQKMGMELEKLYQITRFDYENCGFWRAPFL